MKKALILYLVIAFNVTIQASTYYVAKNGNDSSAGTEPQPFLTISKAVGKAVAGDTVIIQPGSYAEKVTVNKAGTESAPITFQGNSGPVIAGNLNIGGSYLIFTGLTISPPNAGGWSAIEVGGNNNKLLRCTVTNYGAKASDQAAAISTGGSFNTVDGCSILALNDIDAFHVWGHDITISNNIANKINAIDYQANHTDWIQSWGLSSDQESYNILIIGNTVTDSTCQLGNTENNNNSKLHDWTFANNIFVNISGALFSGIPKTNFYNNLFENCGDAQGYAISLYTQTNYSSVGDRFNNNVFRKNQKDVNLNSTSSSQLDSFTHNYFAGSNNLAVTNGQYMGTSFINGGDPKFVDEAARDYHLKTGSVLIGKGIELAKAFEIDKDGKTRVPPWDIGPYAFNGEAPGPTPTPSATPSPEPSATPVPTPTPQAKFKVGDSVETTSGTTNVRATPSGTILGTQGKGSTGTVLDGPEIKDLKETVAWYKVDFVSGADGWVGDDNLVLITAPVPTPTPTPTPVPTPQPTPTPPTSGGPTYNQWAHEFNQAQADWVRAHPPTPDQ